MKPKLAFALITSIVCAFLLFIAARSFAQTGRVRSLITEPVDESKLAVLRGNVHPLARVQFDHGVAADNLPMDHMLLVLKRSQSQQTALETLMAQQLDKSSPSYHKWLTPQQFGQMFGPSDQDIQKISAWLVSHGFTIDNVTNGRTVIEFSGDAAQVQSAFHTPIHSYVVKGEQHWANASDPAIPAALTPAVAGVRSLHNFYPRPMSHVRGPFIRSQVSSQSKVRPNYSFLSSGPCSLVQFLDALLTQECNMLGPGDFDIIYNIQNLGGIDGSGETIAIVADSNINTADAQTFRTLWGLPSENLTVIVNGSDPGKLKSGDETEAILDVEWSGAVAPAANIDLVVSKSSPATFGGDLSAVCIVNGTAPCPATLPAVLSESFGACEQALTGSETVNGKNFASANAFYNATWQQAATEGITVIVSSGDNGSSGCDIAEVNGPPSQPAQDGLQVNGLASTPFNVAVGGTDFNDVSNPGTYWSGLNAANTSASALGYIPETTWNDSCTNSIFLSLGETDTETACNDSTLNSEAVSLDGVGVQAPIGGSGGASGVYAKPAWQTALTLADGHRDLPDISLFAGEGTISASSYYLCESDLVNGSPACSLTTNIFGAGGTSISAQAFAGIMALVDEKTGSAQGNINPTLYTLASQDSTATCNSSNPPAQLESNCFFYDITAGTIAMPCAKGSTNCNVTAQIVGPSFRPGRPAPWITPATVALLCLLLLGSILAAVPGKTRRWGTALAMLALVCLLGGAAACGGSGSGGSNGSSGGGPDPNNFTVGVLSGYSAGTGYDEATGLGSVNVQKLVNQWP
ncbi:MAG TPA: S53 family peptidase [Candidatus Acidoferrales bacterium]|nr:S53 family peptidase [Candidatus Acidoferrales bacterium]